MVHPTSIDLWLAIEGRRWRSSPHNGEVMVLASFYEHDFGLPLHPFALCEAYLGMGPHWKLCKHLLSPRVNPG